MLRSAAKNYRDVTVVCDPEDYARIISEIEATGNTTPKTRLELSAKAYTHTAEYDMCIATYMRKQAELNEKFPKQVFATPKKMGAETAEANINAGLAAAQQICDYFATGCTKFQLNK